MFAHRESSFEEMSPQNAQQSIQMVSVENVSTLSTVTSDSLNQSPTKRLGLKFKFVLY